MRHVDIPPHSDHLRLDCLMLLAFFLRVLSVPKLIVIVAFPYPVFSFCMNFSSKKKKTSLYPFNWPLKTQRIDAIFSYNAALFKTT